LITETHILSICIAVGSQMKRTYSKEEREEIRAGLSAKLSIRAIARRLNRSPSTISREVNRNRALFS